MSLKSRARDLMGTVDKSYFIELGLRIAALRKERGLTQVQLAEALGFSQPQILSFEKGRRRIPVSLLPELAEILGVNVEDLLGIAKKNERKPGPLSKLEKQFERISRLPKSRQKFVSEVIEAVLQQAS